MGQIQPSWLLVRITKFYFLAFNIFLFETGRWKFEHSNSAPSWGDWRASWGGPLQILSFQPTYSTAVCGS